MRGIRRADEMEANFGLRATRFAWAYGVVFLLLWIVVDWVWKGTFNATALILMSSQLVVYWAAHLVLRRRVGGNEE